MTPEHELFDTIEDIRSKGFPELSADLVKHIAAIERDYSESRQEAYKRISKAIDDHLAKKTGA